MLRAVKELNANEGITVLWITHHMDEAAAADRVLVMNRGKVVLEGAPRKIFSQVEIMQQYGLDVPQVTLLAHELIRRGLPVPPDAVTPEELVEAVSALLDGQEERAWQS